MKKLLVNPGICGFKTLVEASADKETGDVTVKVASGCPAVQKMMDEVGDTFDSYALCRRAPAPCTSMPPPISPPMQPALSSRALSNAPRRRASWPCPRK